MIENKTFSLLSNMKDSPDAYRQLRIFKKEEIGQELISHFLKEYSNHFDT